MQKDPDVTLVEWLLNSMQTKPEMTIDQAKQGKTNTDTKDSDSELPERPFRKNEKNLRDDLDDLFKFNPITRERLKRNDDGRGIAFHQCYWNPVSCFR